VDVNRLKY